MDPVPLSEVFTAPGAVLWAGLIIAFVELAKRLTPLAETGRAPIYLSAVLALLVVGSAHFEAGIGFTPTAIAGSVFAFVNVLAAASGGFELGRKAYRVATGTTNPAGEDAPESP